MPRSRSGRIGVSLYLSNSIEDIMLDIIASCTTANLPIRLRTDALTWSIAFDRLRRESMNFTEGKKKRGQLWDQVDQFLILGASEQVKPAVVVHGICWDLARSF